MSLKLVLAPIVALCVVAVAASAARAQAPAAGSDPAVEARDALRRKDGAALLALRDRTAAQQHALAQWVDYWELANRLGTASQSELDAFYARWPNTYVEDRLRNDWLLELGKRRDWANLAREYPRFRMNDDAEVTCYALLNEHQSAAESGKQPSASLKTRALQAWFDQREADDGCQLMATNLVDAKVFSAADAWRKARYAAEQNRLRSARHAAGLAAPSAQASINAALDNPGRYLVAGNGAGNGAGYGARTQAEIATLALLRLAANDAAFAAAQLTDRWQARLPADLSAWAWARAGRHAASELLPEAAGYFRNAWSEAERSGQAPQWSDDTLAWGVRGALRSSTGSERWSAVLRATDHMSDNERRDTAWRYWRAHGLRETAAPAAAGEKQRGLATSLLALLADELHFYGKLAAEDLGRVFTVPARPDPLSPAELEAARSQPGLTRALQLIALGLRSEGVREWNFSLRGMNERALLAAADRACEAKVWDRCINTSDRTKVEIDLEQRFPMPFRDDVVAASQEIGVDAAYVYGLIRQESRFIMDARSSVGASGLMQVMPATAKWTAKKIGLPFTQDMITDRNVNLRIGTSYLKLVLDDFGGSQAMAAAAYNAGPNRPRRWREGALLEPAIWAENIPFAETRDYVKKVLSNATVYAAMLAGQRQPAKPAPPPAPAAPAAPASAASAASAAAPPPAPPAPPAPTMALPSIKSRLGALIGPRDAAQVPANKELP
jgi:soluble lytic murein transglycosylase